MISVETVQGMVGRGMKENGGGVNSSTIYLIYCKNFYKCHPAQQLKKTFLVYINGIIP
jgi:hypothetical protein